MNKLVVVESPSKAKTIQKYLGKGYTVKSSKGHIVDLPKSDLGVDTEKDFDPTYVVTKEATLRDLKKAFKDKDGLVLAVDPDREGEAIGWHVARELGLISKKGKSSRKKKTEKTLERIVFTEITKDAVQEAIKNPRKLDQDLINAQQARRVLDRLVGYKLSPLIWKKVRYGLSAGRVQSVAVKLIVDREIEREKFKADEYWSISAYLDEKKGKKVQININLSEDEKDEKLAKKKAELIEFNLVKVKGKKPELEKQKEVDKIIKDLDGNKWLITDIQKKESKRRPRPPFSTSMMQQAAANRMGFGASRTMRAAQKLYEAGHITYMRTDSITMSQQAVQQIRKHIDKAYGKKFLPDKPNNYTTKSKVAQEAHEAIRPTNVAKDHGTLSLKGDEAKLYELIRKRALASQMVPAIVENNKLIVEFGDYVFQANGQRVIFDGYLKVYPEKISENVLPKLAKGEELFPHVIEGDQHFTQPPPRYSEATLIKTLESLGIGRPSTYAPIIQTIQTRKYVEKENKYFFPTDTGRVVNNLLSKHFAEIVDAGFTAEMEDDLDKVANGDEDWVKMMADFYNPFEKKLANKQEELKKEDFTVLGKSKVKCPECGKPMQIKLGRFGRFLSCSDFPDCKGMLGLDEDGNVEKPPEERVKDKEFVSTYMPAPQTDDKRDYLLKRGRYGEFWAHPDYPKVKDAKPLELRPEKIRELYGEPPLTKDKKEFLLRNGRFGPFWAHPDYPEVKEIRKIKKDKKAKK